MARFLPRYMARRMASRMIHHRGAARGGGGHASENAAWRLARSARRPQPFVARPDAARAIRLNIRCCSTHTPHLETLGLIAGDRPAIAHSHPPPKENSPASSPDRHHLRHRADELLLLSLDRGPRAAGRVGHTQLVPVEVNGVTLKVPVC